MTVIIGGVAVLLTLVMVLILVNVGETRRDSALDRVGASLDSIGIRSGRQPRQLPARLDSKDALVDRGAADDAAFLTLNAYVPPFAGAPALAPVSSRAKAPSRSNNKSNTSTLAPALAPALKSNYAALRAAGGASDQGSIDYALVREVAQMELEFMQKKTKKQQRTETGNFDRENATRRARTKLRMPSNLNLNQKRRNVFSRGAFGGAA